MKWLYKALTPTRENRVIKADSVTGMVVWKCVVSAGSAWIGNRRTDAAIGSAVFTVSLYDFTLLQWYAWLRPSSITQSSIFAFYSPVVYAKAALAQGINSTDWVRPP